MKTYLINTNWWWLIIPLTVVLAIGQLLWFIADAMGLVPEDQI
jgi:ABC-type dipeptide/oligopeptide/nickel transport system permease subunit